MRHGLVRIALIAALVLSSPAVLAQDEKGSEGEKPEDPAVVERRKKLELEERRENLPASAKASIALVDGFRDRDFRVWSSLRDDLVVHGKDSIPALLIGLEELDWETRAFSASCLAIVGGTEEAAALADAYRAEKKFIELRRQCVLALGEIRAPTSVEVLLEASREEDVGVRLAATRALGALVTDKAAGRLRALSEDNELDIRYEALGSLAALGDEAAVETLLKAVKELVDTKDEVRVDSTNIEDNGDRYEQYLIGLSLARADSKEAEKILVAALLAKKPWSKKSFLRMGAAEGLGRRAAESGVVHPKLSSAISHNKNEVRVAGSYGAGWAALPELVGKLAKGLGDSQHGVRQNSVMALGRIGGGESAKALRKALRDKAGEIRIGALRALDGIHHPEATAGLITATRDGKYMVRVMAIRTLRYRTTEDGVLRALARSLKDADYGVREQALASLAHHPVPDDVLDVVVGRLHDRDFGVRTNACLALARLTQSGDFELAETPSRQVVGLYLDTKLPRLEKAARECLDAVRPPHAVPALIAGLGSALEEQRRRANLALQTIGETSQEFQADGAGNERAGAIKRWRKWWEGRDGALPKRGGRARAAITGKLSEAARDLKWKGLDIALLFDSTYSMAALIRAAKERTGEIIHELNGLLPSLRVSVFTYRDYGDTYVWYGTPLTYDTWKLPGFLQNCVHGQGGDLPEAVFETTRNAMEKLDWRPQAHKVVVYAGDAPHHPEYHDTFIATIKKFCTKENNAVLHALYTDTKRVSIDIKARKKRDDLSSWNSPFFDRYRETAEAGRGKAVLLSDESALIKELLVLTFGEAWRTDIENLLDFEY